MTIGALILAAGAATRMGQIKQLLPYRGVTLLEHAIHQAVPAEFDRLVVVLGAEATRVSEAVERTPARWVVNQQWRSGMGSSIAAGIQELLNLDAAAILLADQPFITFRHLLAMKQAFLKSHSPVLAAQYGGMPGVPAFFRSSYFPLLQSLAPAAGARALLRNSEEIEPFDLPEALTDIDQPADLSLLRL